MLGGLYAQPQDSTFETRLQAVEKTTQFPDGVIIFPASDSKNDVEVGHIDPTTGEHDLKLPRVLKNAYHWDYKPTRWGMYEVELTGAAHGENQSVIEIKVAGHGFAVTPKSTGGTNEFQTIRAGRFYLEKSEPLVATVQNIEGGRSGLFSIKALTLRPAPEGGPIVQAPTKQSFGTRLIETLGQQLKGEVRITYAPSGLVYALDVPLASLTSPVAE